MDRFSFLNAAHAALLEQTYEKYTRAPDSVEPSWCAFFQGYDFARTHYNSDSQPLSPSARVAVPAEISGAQIEKEFRVINLIEGYRGRGHLFTRTNPVRRRRVYRPDLSLENFGLSATDLDTSFQAGDAIGIGVASLRDIVKHLEAVYCESIGTEYRYIRQPEERKWIQDWLHPNDNHPTFSAEEKKHLLFKLNQAVVFERFLNTKFVGQKRFSLEGNESLIPGLDELISRAADRGAVEFIVGMAHRGRLNVLTNTFGKAYEKLFSEFEGKDFEEAFFEGDVKYHLGLTTRTITRQGAAVQLNLAPNPSHLEAVGPVVAGIARARIDQAHRGDYNKVVPILIHGDAAIAAQGVVYELVQMMRLKGYQTGGTLHIVVNNQIGFTTNYIDGRSSTYCTDVGKANLSPVLHVNADDVEAVVHAMRFAVDYRMRYQKDVFIDLLGYRKYGHNEGDEPRFTQPELYKAIAAHPDPLRLYSEKLIGEGEIEQSAVKALEADFKALLDRKFEESKQREKNTLDPFMPSIWEGYRFARATEHVASVDTRFPAEKLEHIARVLSTPPQGEKFLRKTLRLLEQRHKMVFETDAIDWGMAEMLAYGSLLLERYDVRLSGEDVARGTFSHRHAKIMTEEAEREYILLNRLADSQGSLSVYNSPLSEYAVMGFDYGYAMASPRSLTLWEAQFGDFSNGAQILIDQYLMAAEDKWKIQNGLVLLLPHGYEGQGAEHSSARIERYLQLCAQFNAYALNCSTPANFYHALRRHMKRDFRKPLIVFTPKGLLRHPKAVSTLSELAEGAFQSVLDDPQAVPNQIRRVVLCQGKFYYDLLAYRQAQKQKDTALLRIEQLYPLDRETLDRLSSKYHKAKTWIWAQEEPENMGAWRHLFYKLRHLQLRLISPPESAAPASGSAERFQSRYQSVIESVFKPSDRA